MAKSRTSFTKMSASEAGRRGNRRRLGLAGARTNRMYGWQNLKLARAVRSRNAEWRRRERVRELAAQIHLMVRSPWGPRDAWVCVCGEFGVGDSMARLHSAGAPPLLPSRDRVLRPQERGRQTALN